MDTLAELTGHAGIGLGRWVDANHDGLIGLSFRPLQRERARAQGLNPLAPRVDPDACEIAWAQYTALRAAAARHGLASFPAIAAALDDTDFPGPPRVATSSGTLTITSILG